MGKFNTTFNEYARDNYISAEELQELAKKYSSQVLSGRPDASDNYNKEWRLNDEKAFWKKFKENYKKAGGEKLGVAGVAGRADREKLIAAYRNPQYGPPVKEVEKEKEEDFEGKDYNLDFSESFKIENQDVSNIDRKYSIEKDQKRLDKIAGKAESPGSYKSYLNKLRGAVKASDKMMVNKQLTRDIKKNKKQINALSKFNPDPLKVTTFKEASYKPKALISENRLKKKVEKKTERKVEKKIERKLAKNPDKEINKRRFERKTERNIRKKIKKKYGKR